MSDCTTCVWGDTCEGPCLGYLRDPNAETWDGDEDDDAAREDEE